MRRRSPLGLILCLIALTVGACVAAPFTYEPPKKLKKDEAVVFGRVRVVRDRRNISGQCYVCFEPLQTRCRKLNRSGLIVLEMTPGVNRLVSLGCRERFERHTFLKDTHFQVKGGKKNFFGDIELEWSDKPEFREELIYGHQGVLRKDASRASELKMIVSTVVDPVLEIYHDAIGGPEKDLLVLRKGIVGPKLVLEKELTKQQLNAPTEDAVIRSRTQERTNAPEKQKENKQ
jgi:hypothetical protein